MSYAQSIIIPCFRVLTADFRGGKDPGQLEVHLIKSIITWAEDNSLDHKVLNRLGSTEIPGVEDGAQMYLYMMYDVRTTRRKNNKKI